MRTHRDTRVARWTRWLMVALFACACRSPTATAKVVSDRAATDAGSPDSGLATGPEPGLDAGPDAGADAGVDAGVVTVHRTGRFFTHADRPIRSALVNQEIVGVERGRGGRSLGFKITLSDGTRAYFKPAQAFTGMSWQSELAAFYLDRELGLGRTAPSIGRRVAWSELAEAAGEDRRVPELEIADGWLSGALIWWVPDRLRPLELPEGWQRWLRIDSNLPPVCPFQRPLAYREQVAALGDDTPADDAEHSEPLPERTEPPEPDREDRPAELSDMIVFDYLIHNGDRFGTHQTNIRTIGTGGPLMFLDNAAGFTMRRARTSLMDTRLAQVQRFRRSTIEAVEHLSQRRFHRRLDQDPLGPLLDETQRENFELRRRYLLAYVRGLIERFGEEEVLVW